jgi:poly(3-hydroxybutyrate) depolymerase
MSLAPASAGGVRLVTGTKDGFPYCVHRPAPRNGEAPHLLVALHGSDYQHETMCRFFAGLADETNTVVLAPLLRRESGPTDPEGFKFLRSQHGTYDGVLLAMVDEVAQEFGIASRRFVLFGFSGGAQFAHRFFYLHPERLHAVSLAAPGMVTLVDDAHDCWIGVRDFAARFGQPVDSSALRRVQVQTLVGANDAVPHVGVEGSTAYDHAGRHRVERLRTLARNFRDHGIDVEHLEVEGVAHEFGRLGEAALPFLRRELTRLATSTRAAEG